MVCLCVVEGLCLVLHHILTKMRPCLMPSLLGLSAMVHRNTNEYMDASNMDCIAPSSAMAGSVRVCGCRVVVFVEVVVVCVGAV